MMKKAISEMGTWDEDGMDRQFQREITWRDHPRNQVLSEGQKEE